MIQTSLLTRKQTQVQRLLRLLRERGRAGVTNIELNELIGFRYGARIWELRRDGYDIRKRHLKGAKWQFWLEQERVYGED